VVSCFVVFAVAKSGQSWPFLAAAKANSGQRQPVVGERQNPNATRASQKQGG